VSCCEIRRLSIFGSFRTLLSYRPLALFKISSIFIGSYATFFSFALDKSFLIT
jgi:hypothetical protein